MATLRHICSRLLVLFIVLMILTIISQAEEDIESEGNRFSEDEYKPICAEENERPSLGIYLRNNTVGKRISYLVLLLHTDQECHEVITGLHVPSSPLLEATGNSTGKSPASIINGAWTASQSYATIVNATHRILTAVTVAEDTSMPWPERREYKENILETFDSSIGIDIEAIPDCFFLRPASRSSSQEEFVLLPNSLCVLDERFIPEMRVLPYDESDGDLDEYITLVHEFLEQEEYQIKFKVPTSVEREDRISIPVKIVGRGQFVPRVIEALNLEADPSVPFVDYADIAYNAAIDGITERSKGCIMWDEYVSFCDKQEFIGGSFCYSCSRENDMERRGVDDRIAAYVSEREQKLCPNKNNG